MQVLGYAIVWHEILVRSNFREFRGFSNDPWKLDRVKLNSCQKKNPRKFATSILDYWISINYKLTANNIILQVPYLKYRAGTCPRSAKIYIFSQRWSVNPFTLQSAKFKTEGKVLNFILRNAQNKQYHLKVLLNSFYLNGHTLGFHRQTYKSYKLVKVTTTFINSRFDSGSKRVKQHVPVAKVRPNG